MKIKFDTCGNKKQQLAAKYWIDQTTKEIGYGGAKGGGKSYLGVSLIFGDALIYPNTRYYIARKKLNDLRKHTIPTIHEVFNHWGLSKDYFNFNGTDNFYELYNGSKVLLVEVKYQPSDPLYERFGSMQMTRGWNEESGEFEFNARSNLAASIGRWENTRYNLMPKLLETCNPKKNYMYSLYYKMNKNNELPEYRKFIQALPDDNKMLPPEYIEQLRRVLTKSQKERLLLGNWEYDDDPMALIEDYDSILELFTNPNSFEGKKYITADVARFGSDKAVIMVWDGWNIIEIFSFDKSKTTEIQDKIIEFQRKYNIPNKQVIVDQDGVGGGVMDSLNCKGFTNNAKPIPVDGSKENFDNIKSQCGFGLAKVINNSDIAIKYKCDYDLKEKIIEELEVLKRKDELTLRLISKDEMKELIGRSPDYLDSMLMRYYFEIKPILKAPTYYVDN